MSLDDLSPLHLEHSLRTRRFGRSLELRELTDSTNDDARKAANAGAPDGHVVLADAQNHGRGSRGRSWSSPAGSDLYLSIVAKADLPIVDLPPLTLAVGLGVAEAVDQLLGGEVRAQIKWPNDVWVDDQKIAGILVEAASLGDTALPLIIGIGLNVNRESFDAGLETPPTSLKLVSGERRPREQVLRVLLERVEHWFDVLTQGGRAQVISAVVARLALLDQQVTVDERRGVLLGISDAGALQLQQADGIHHVYAGTLRRA